MRKSHVFIQSFGIYNHTIPHFQYLDSLPPRPIRSLQLGLHLGDNHLPDPLEPIRLLHPTHPPGLVLQPLELLRQHLLHEIRLVLGQRLLDGVAEFRRVRRGKRNVVRGRRSRDIDVAQGGREADCRVRIEDVPLRRGGAEDVLDGVEGLVVGDAVRGEVVLRGAQDLCVDGEAALGLEVVEPRLDVVAGLGAALGDGVRGRAVHLVGEEPEEAFEVGRHEDVHGRAERFLDAARVGFCAVGGDPARGGCAVYGVLLVGAGFPEAVEDVVFVCGDDELLRWEPHAFREVAGEDVAEVAGGDDEADLGGGEEGGLADEGEVRVEVVGDLGEDAGPVDGVDGGELVRAVDFGVGEEGFDEVLGGLVEG